MGWLNCFLDSVKESLLSLEVSFLSSDSFDEDDYAEFLLLEGDFSATELKIEVTDMRNDIYAEERKRLLH